jgi:hypothetical protein
MDTQVGGGKVVKMNIIYSGTVLHTFSYQGLAGEDWLSALLKITPGNFHSMRFAMLLFMSLL